MRKNNAEGQKEKNGSCFERSLTLLLIPSLMALFSVPAFSATTYKYGTELNEDNGYSVTLESGESYTYVIGNLAGTSSYDSSASSNNIVTINGGTVTNIYGGASDEKNTEVSSNKIYIYADAGGASGKIYGGYVTASGSVDNNIIYVGSEATVKGYIVGGYSASGNVTGNGVEISGGTVNNTSTKRYVTGGYAADGNAINNSVTLQGATIYSKTVYVYGGYASGNSAGNGVSVSSNSVVSATLYGNYAASGYAAGTYSDEDGNSITVTAVKITDSSITGSVYGGYVNTVGSAYDNSVKLENSTVTGTVYGGYVKTEGNTYNNTVMIENSTVSSKVYGGYSNTSGDACNNSVTIRFESSTDSTTSQTSTDDVYGGYAKSGNVSGNTVSISGSRVDEEDGSYSYTVSVDDIYGGYTSVGNAEGNSVTITGTYIESGTTNKYIYGGQTKSGSSSANSVNVSYSYIHGSIYGNYASGIGFSATGTYTDEDGNENKVVSVYILDSYVDNVVYGGYGYSSSGATDNTVIIEGTAETPTDGTSYDYSYTTYARRVYGGYSSGGNATGNTVEITGSAIGSFELNDDASGIYDWINGEVYGGYSGGADAEVRNNGVTVTDSFAVSVYGGYADASATVSGNNATVKNSYVSMVIGGYGGGQSSTVSGNTVTISGSSVLNEIEGGYGYKPDSTVCSNYVSIEEGSVIGSTSSSASIYGGQARQGGDAIDNSVEITDSTVYGTIYGGYAVYPDYVENGGSGDALGNSVSIVGGTVTGNIFGNFASNGNVSGTYTVEETDESGDVQAYEYSTNSVTIKDSTVEGNVIGGYTESYGNATYNSVIVLGSSVTDDIVGGYSELGNVCGNSVTVDVSSENDSVTIGGDIYGGQSESDTGTDEDGNTVSVSSNLVYLGITEDEVSGTSKSENGSGSIYVTGDVYGGYSLVSDVVGNSVYLGGNVTIESSVYGGYSQTGSVSGNVLNVSGTGNSVGSEDTEGTIGYFETITFDVEGLSAGDTMLTLAGAADLSSDVADDGISVSNADSVDLDPGEFLTLVSDEAGIEVTEDKIADVDVTKSYALKEDDSSLTGSYEYGIEMLYDEDETMVTSLVLQAGDTITVSDVSLVFSDMVSSTDDALLTLEAYSYVFPEEGITSSLSVSSGAESVTIEADSSVLAGNGDVVASLIDGSSATEVDGLENLSFSLGYEFETGTGVTVSGTAVSDMTDDEKSLNLVIETIDTITYGEVLYDKDTPVASLDSSKTYDLSSATIDLSGLVLLDEGGDTIETLEYDDADDMIFMTLLETNGIDTGLVFEDTPFDDISVVDYALTDEAISESRLEGTLDAAVGISSDNDLVLKAGTNVTVTSVSLDLTGTDWDGETALLTLNDSLVYDFEAISSEDGTFTLSEDLSTTDFLDVGSTLTLIDGSDSTAENTDGLVVSALSYTYELKDGTVVISGSASTSVSGSSLYYNISGIESMDFYITSDTSTDEAILSVSSADLSGTAVTAYAEGGSYLTSGYSVTLLEADDGGLTTDESTTYTGTITEGVSVDYELTVEKVDDTIVAYIAEDEDAADDTVAEEDEDTTEDTVIAEDEDVADEEVTTASKSLRNETKSLVETRLAQTALIDQGQEKIAYLLDAGSTFTRGSTMWVPFVSMSASSLSYDTGSSVDIDGFNASVGILRNFSSQDGDLTVGASFQYGRGEYDSYAEGVDADGDTDYVGAAIMARHRWSSGVYVEGSVSAGYSQADYGSSSILSGSVVTYDVGSKYWGLHVGVGREIDLSAGKTLNVYGRYYYSHLDSSSALLSSGETYHFNDVDSSRIRLGARFSNNVWDNGGYYFGAAYQYQFRDDARATYNGLSTLSPSLQGSSGMLEAGLMVTPKSVENLTVDLGVTGWAGKQKGVEVSLKLKWDI